MRSLLVVAGLLAARPVAADTLSVTVTTTPNGGPYSPRNVVAIWIEDVGGNFVKTIDRWGKDRIDHLVAWGAKSSFDQDAVSGATRLDHSQPLTMMWDCRNKAGIAVQDGTYNIRMELADSNASQPGQNHEGTFTFVKGPTGSVQQNLSNGGFNNVSITFTAGASCGNGVMDPGEVCDGNCPATCAPSADACVTMNLFGTAASCTATCVPLPITACRNGDGCCPMGCTGDNDDDCGPGGGGGSGGGGEFGGACNAGSSGAIPMLLLILGAFVIRRRR